MIDYTPRPRTPEWERDTAALVAAAELARHDEECGCVATSASGWAHRQAIVAHRATKVAGLWMEPYPPIELHRGRGRDHTLITRFRSIA